MSRLEDWNKTARLIKDNDVLLQDADTVRVTTAVVLVDIATSLAVIADVLSAMAAEAEEE